MHPNRSKARRYFFASVAGASFAAAAGCAAPGKGSSVPEPRATPGNSLTPAVSALIESGKREERHPSIAAESAPPPEGVDTTLGLATTGDATRTRISLAQALSQSPKPPESVPPSDIDSGRRAESLRHYVQGRQLLLAGDPLHAAAELRSATELDPGAGEPWRELGETQLAQGMSGEAISSFRASVGTGLREPRTLELLGRSALERGDHADALRFLAAALEAKPDRADPALTRLILIELSRALAPQGYIVAAKEAIEQALSGPAQVSASTRYSPELGAIFRRQGELWRDVGDAMCRLGEYAGAVEAYQHSAELPTVDGKPILPRIVFAWMRAGRPSTAAGSVLDWVTQHQGRLGLPEAALLSYITTHGGDARLIADAVGSLKSAGNSPHYPSLDRGLTLAQAAILPVDAAIPVLRAHVEAHPTHVRAAVRLFDSLPSPQAAAMEAMRLASQNPVCAKSAAEALLQCRFEVAPMLESLQSQGRTDAPSLLLAYTIAKQGRYAEALSLAERVKGTTPAGLVALCAQIELSAVLGNPEVMRRAIQELATSPAPLARRLLANGQVLSQRYRAALETIRPLLAGPAGPERIGDLTLAGDIALRLARAQEAEQWINQAAQLDPFDDGPASLLLVLHSAGGPSPDAAKLTRIVRDMRRDLPDSRTLRLIRARETMRRTQWAQTESELRQLCREDPGDPAPMELLAATWIERLKVEPGAADDARTWLDALIRRRPQSPVLLSGSTTLEACRGRAADAVTPLKAALTDGAGPDVSRILERVLREPLGKMAEADGLIEARLENRPLTLQGSIEAADFKSRAKQAEEAIGILHDALTPEIDIARDQVDTLLTLVGSCISEVKDPNNTVVMSAAALLLDRLIALHPGLPVELHQRRLEALTSCLDCGAEKLLDAINLCVQQHPSLQARPYVMVSVRLRGLGRTSAANEFITGAVAAAPSDADLLEEWFIVVFACGTAQDARPMIEAIHASGKMRTVLDRVAERAQVALRAEDPTDLRSDAAYLLGSLYSTSRKTVQADAAFELALSFNPKHPWASNDLGYALADRGVDMERASRLLELAADKLPKEGSVLDSLGWLRYKQGIILDEHDPKTGLLKRRGGLSLLETAARTPRGQQDITILDHLGDARWLAGQSAAAIQAWTAAATLSRDTLVQVEQQNRARQPVPAEPIEDSAAVAEARTLDASTKAKIDATAKGLTVHVAPQIGNPDPQPAAPKTPNN